MKPFTVKIKGMPCEFAIGRNPKYFKWNNERLYLRSKRKSFSSAVKLVITREVIGVFE